MSEIFGGIMAFPIHNTGHGAPFDEGMTLRDYFAAKAMAQYVGATTSKDWASKQSYEWADAMMQHRDSGE
jgi:hypothetical protein